MRQRLISLTRKLLAGGSRLLALRKKLPVSASSLVPRRAWLVAAAGAAPSAGIVLGRGVQAILSLRDRAVNIVRRNKYYREAVPFALAGVLSCGLSYLIRTQTALAALWIAIGIFVTICVINPRLGFLVWLFTSPLTTGRNYDVARGVPSITFDRVTLLLLLTLVMAQKAVARRRGVKIQVDSIDLLLITFAGLAVFSALFPAQVDITRPRGLKSLTAKLQTTTALQGLLDHYFLPFGTFFIARALLDNERWLWRALVVVAFMPLYLGPVAVIENRYGISFWSRTGELVWKDIGKGRAGGPFVNPISFGIVLGTCLVFALFVYYTLPKVRVRILVLISIGLACIAALFTYTRSAWISIVGRLLFFAAFSPRVRKAILIPILLMVVALVLFRASVTQSDLFQKRVIVTSTIEARMVAQRSMINMIRDRPWFGFGAGRYKDYQYLYYETAGGAVSSHNTYLSIIAEIGIVGFIPYLLVFAVMAFRTAVAYRILPDKAGIISKGLVAAVAANIFGYVIAAFTQDNRHDTYIEYAFWVNIAILWLCHRRALELAAQAEKAREVPMGPIQDRAVAQPTPI